MACILNMIKDIQPFKWWLIVNTETIGISIVLLYMFNILVGLLPLLKVLKKMPAKILTSNSIE